MWLTGCAAQSCSTVYLDKPRRNHTLMQTIARANGVFPGKHGGVIVDYANVFAALEQALALICGARREVRIRPRTGRGASLALAAAIAATTAFCAGHRGDLPAMKAVPVGNLLW